MGLEQRKTEGFVSCGLTGNKTTKKKQWESAADGDAILQLWRNPNVLLDQLKSEEGEYLALMLTVFMIIATLQLS